jgi:surfactin synthase thioesterase subunit
MGTHCTVGTEPSSDPQLWLRRFGGDGQGSTPDEARAWAEHAPANGFEFEVLPGGHFFLVDRAPEVLSLLRTRLRPVPADGHAGVSGR